jgi:alginate O-acetyltransferase complex protein AlgI
MLFNSLYFLYLFLPVTYFVFWRLRTKVQRYVWLTITGYVFYSFWNPKFCGLMALSTAVSYGAGLGFLRWKDARRRRLCLVLPIIFDLSLLGTFKYANFVLSTGNWLLQAVHLNFRAPSFDIVLPIGISFYTFHTITYIVDSYRGVITPTRNVFEFSCYVSLFSQLVAGPIVRFRQIEGDLENIDHANRREYLERGWSFFVLGMVKKVLIADSIAWIINPALAQWQSLSTPDAWLCMLGYTYQLYFDFSGYSDMAVGLGAMFGIRLPQNFNSPYKAIDISDFWKRWHISLSSVLRDYLYIPLGGSRNGEWKTCRNLMVTMLLGGLWHGANWTFVAWGAYHGALLVATRYGRAPLNLWPAPLRKVTTFVLVIIGWVLFRSSSFSMASGILATMFSWTPGIHLDTGKSLVALLLIAGTLAHFGPNTFELRHRWNPLQASALGVLLLTCIVFIYGGQQSPFLYFQF